jgi:hypothetical protein
MADPREYDPELTEQLLEEGDRRLSESRKVLEDLKAVLEDGEDGDGRPR